MNPEIQALMEANQTQRCLQPGTTNLGQEAFQVLKNQTRMRQQMDQGDIRNYEDLVKYQTIQMERRQKMIDDLAQHHKQIAEASDKRRQTQREFGRYWRMQMDWNAKTRSDKKSKEELIVV